MSFLGWMGLAGALLLVVALSSAYVCRLPLPTSTLYLLVGILVSPLAFNLITVDIVEGRVWFGHLILIHGITSQPILKWYGAKIARTEGPSGD